MIYKMIALGVDSLFRWVAILVIGCLLAISILMYWKRTSEVTDVILHQDIEQLRKVFDKIHKDCYILDFKHVKNHIDFLNVIHFVGSEIGSMNLAFAKNWHGPYLKNNPKFHEKLYAVLKNKHGYFIVPADGVVLGNGKEIGKDIILDEHTDMRRMMHSDDALFSPAGVLAAPIQVGHYAFAQMVVDPAVAYQAID